jgi:hypothetical protein
LDNPIEGNDHVNCYKSSLHQLAWGKGFHDDDDDDDDEHDHYLLLDFISIGGNDHVNCNKSSLHQLAWGKGFHDDDDEHDHYLHNLVHCLLEEGL